MSIKDTQKLKQLNTRKVKMEAEIERLADESKDANRKLDGAKNQLTLICKEIDSLKAEAVDPVVTEHAIIRYMERAMGLNVDVIKAEILNPKTVNCIRTFGNGKYPIGNGCRAVVKDNTVVSVL